VEVVSIRPHDWQILQKESSDSSSAFSGIVKTVHYKGTHLEVVFESGAMQIIINAPIKDAIKEGEELAVAPKFD
jgi:ABC-type Fe3+/spermidine/putrescine transport system ATPase subunit